MSKKIPISFNRQDLENIEVLAKLFNLDKAYGKIPKTIKVSITFAVKYMENIGKLIPDLNDEEMSILLSSIKNIKKAQYIEKEHKKLDKLLD